MKKSSVIKYISVLVIIAALLAGCKPTSVETSKANEATTNQNEDSGYPRTVKHLKGEITLTEAPKRVVALDAAFQDHLIALGVTPIGVTVQPQFGNDFIPYLADELKAAGAEAVGDASNVNLEKILSLQPDIIIATSWIASQIYDDLAKIAPTFVADYENWDEVKTNPQLWSESLFKIAEVFNKEDLAQEKFNNLQAKIAKAREKISSMEGNKVAFLRMSKGWIGLYGEKNHPINFLLHEGLGFTPSNLTQEERIDLSLELIPELDADYIILQLDAEGGDEQFREVTQSPLWKNVPAVEKNNIFSPEYWLYKSWGTIGREEIVDEVLEFIK